MRGFLLWQQEALEKPPAVLSALKKWREDSDNVTRFIRIVAFLLNGKILRHSNLSSMIARGTVRKSAKKSCRTVFSRSGCKMPGIRGTGSIPSGSTAVSNYDPGMANDRDDSL